MFIYIPVILITLYASYAFILRQSLSRNTYDLTDSIYEGYYIEEIINNRYDDFSTFLSTECTALSQGYICNIAKSTNLKILNDIYKVDKIYYINPYKYYKKDYDLNQLDATTIDYIKTIGASRNKDMLIIKYKKIYNDDNSYEVFHSMMEV